MVADDERDLGRPLAGLAARRDVVEAVRQPRHEDRDPLGPAGEVDAPAQSRLAPDRLAELPIEVTERDAKCGEVPLETGEVERRLVVDVLLVIHDLPAALVNEVGEGCREPRTHGTVRKKDRRRHAGDNTAETRP